MNRINEVCDKKGQKGNSIEQANNVFKANQQVRGLKSSQTMVWCLHTKGRLDK